MSDRTVYEGLPKKDRKLLAREIARMQREEERKRRKRNRVIRRVGLSALGAGVVALAAFIVVSVLNPPITGPLNMQSDGILFSGDGTTVTALATGAVQDGEDPVATEADTSTGVLAVVEYVDYGNADAATFDTTNGPSIQGGVTAGAATLEIHPVALDGEAGGYSARAANALGCVADTAPDAALAVHNSLMAAQPDLDSDGLSDDELVTLVQTAGVTDDSVASCITSGSFDGWVEQATARAEASVPNSDVSALDSVPLVTINGVAYTGALDDAAAFTTALTDAEAAAVPEGTDPSASPAPEPSATPTG